MRKLLVLLLALMVALVGCNEPQQPLVVYDRPRGNCIEWDDLMRNRPYPPPHGVHFYSKEVPICGR